MGQAVENGAGEALCMVFHYAGGRGGEYAEAFLAGFDGILQVDGYAGYNRLTRPTRKGGDPTIEVAQCCASRARPAP